MKPSNLSIYLADLQNSRQRALLPCQQCTVLSARRGHAQPSEQLCPDARVQSAQGRGASHLPSLAALDHSVDEHSCGRRGRHLSSLVSSRGGLRGQLTLTRTLTRTLSLPLPPTPTPIPNPNKEALAPCTYWNPRGKGHQLGLGEAADELLALLRQGGRWRGAMERGDGEGAHWAGPAEQGRASRVSRARRAGR